MSSRYQVWSGTTSRIKNHEIVFSGQDICGVLPHELGSTAGMVPENGFEQLLGTDQNALNRLQTGWSIQAGFSIPTLS